MRGFCQKSGKLHHLGKNLWGKERKPLADCSLLTWAYPFMSFKITCCED